MTTENPMEANLSTLVLSIASTAAMNLGMAPNPSSGKTEQNLEMAKFNIDLLRVLEEKTQNNTSKDEADLITKIISDLQMQYVSMKKN
tara:strand:- start:4779 stop:5042 length:264 start_codon:yes stop_codon:yes gene_type:complete